jgi:hypothetical protein
MPTASLCGSPQWAFGCECRHGRPPANGRLQVHIHAPTVSPAAQHVSAPMDLAHPAGAESLAPQPSQLASAVDHEIAARQFAQPRWPSPAKSECYPGAHPKIKKGSRPALAAQVGRGGSRAERQDDDGPRRAASRPPHTTGLLVRALYRRGNVSTSSQTPNTCKSSQILLSFWRNTTYEGISHRYAFI